MTFNDYSAKRLVLKNSVGFIPEHLLKSKTYCEQVCEMQSLRFVSQGIGRDKTEENDKMERSDAIVSTYGPWVSFC